MNLVIGSGPSGVACAMALLARGQPVTMLDAGGELEPERRAALDRLRAMDPSQWRGEEIKFLKHDFVPDRNGLGVKNVYGSDFPYRDVARFMPIETIGRVHATVSLAKGGLSNVWGAAILPYRPEEIADWPIGVPDLAPHYEAVLGFMDSSMEEDDLAELFPFYTSRRAPFKRSRQADVFLRDLAAHRKQLQAAGIWFGSARLAMRAAAKAETPGCAYCGLCMYGCPYGLIYSTDTTLQALAANPLFRRVPGVIVDRLREISSGEIEITGRNRADGLPVQFRSQRVYLAAGALSSTRILLRSMEAYGRPVQLRDSQYYLFPLLRYAATPGVMQEALYTMSQAFLELRDPAVGDRTIHLQVYSYNDLYIHAVQKAFGWAAPLLRPAMRPILERLLIIQGFLHSDHSTAVKVTLEQGGDGDRLRLEAASAQHAVDAEIGRILKKLSQNARWLRARPLGFLLNKTPAGRGFHTGGTFPMRRNPQDFETDTLGRPRGFNRVHVVDSTVFPSIPALPITFSVMANAHRIATESYA